MELYIPENLRRIEVVSQLCKLVEAYGLAFEELPEDSFNDYDFYLSYDPVKKFISLCIPGPEGDKEAEEAYYEKWGDQDYETIVNYFSRLFYSVKGTQLVLEYMKDFLDLEIKEEETEYSPGYIKLNFVTIPEKANGDEALFRNLLEGFLNALLFYEVLETNIDRLSLDINNKIVSYIQGGVVTCRINFPTVYQPPTITEEDNTI